MIRCQFYSYLTLFCAIKKIVSRSSLALFNKGTAFKSGERDRLRIRGLLPSRIMNIHLQKERFLLILRAEQSKIKQNILLEDLHDRNETLYHRVLVDHVSFVFFIVIEQSSIGQDGLVFLMEVHDVTPFSISNRLTKWLLLFTHPLSAKLVQNSVYAFAEPVECTSHQTIVATWQLVSNS